jgi:predicted PurR-regulated permease PerM
VNDSRAGTGDAEAEADAVLAARSAEDAAEQAKAAAEEARESAEDAAAQQQPTDQDSDDLLLDSQREPGDSFGTPGPPLKHHSPFYIGFFGAAGAILAIWLGQQIASVSSILILIIVAMFLAVGLNPWVEMLVRRGLKRTWAVLAVIVVVLLALALFVLAIVPVITDQVNAIVDRAPEWFNELRNNDTIQRLDEKYDILGRAQQVIEDGGWTQKVFGGVLGFGLALVSALVNTFIIIVLMLYFLASLPSIKRAAYRLAPASRRERVTDLGDQILRNFGGYVSGAFIVALAAGITSLVFLFIVGLGEYAVALAVVVAVLDVIPMIGATLGAIVVTAIGFATDPKIGLACLIFYVVYQQFENYVVYPRVMARSVDIPGSLIVVAALIGAALLGVVGALLAIPTAAALQLLLREVFVRRQEAR